MDLHRIKCDLTIADEKIFNAIVDGSKKYEGRVNKEPYNKIRKGDLILISLENTYAKFVICEVLEVKKYNSIVEMVKDLWKYLIPFAKSEDEALKVYKQFYDVNKEALAIGIRPLIYFDGFRRKSWKKMKKE